MLPRAVHLQDLERLRRAQKRRDVPNRADIDLAAGQEGHGAGKVDREAALDPAEDHAGHALAALNAVLELPRLLRAWPSRGSAPPRRACLPCARHRPRRCRRVSWRRPGRASPNSFSGTRPSDFRPTSISAMSFSMAMTVPLTTVPSSDARRASDSSSRAAKFSFTWRLLPIPALRFSFQFRCCGKGRAGCFQPVSPRGPLLAPQDFHTVAVRPSGPGGLTARVGPGDRPNGRSLFVHLKGLSTVFSAVAKAASAVMSLVSITRHRRPAAGARRLPLSRRGRPVPSSPPGRARI